MRKTKGFTVVEILIVLFFITIFASLIRSTVVGNDGLKNILIAHETAKTIANKGYIDVMNDMQSEMSSQGTTPFGTNYQLTRGIQGNARKYSYVEYEDADGIKKVVTESISKVGTPFTDKCLLYLEC